MLVSRIEEGPDLDIGLILGEIPNRYAVMARHSFGGNKVYCYTNG